MNALSSYQTFTPQQAAGILQLSTNTVYGLISRGELVAKKIGKVYRIPASSLSFAFTGLDYDLYQKELQDKKVLAQIEQELKKVRES